MSEIQLIQMYDPKRDYQAHKEEFQNAINNVLEHGLFINGPEVTQLEKTLAQYIGTKYCIGIANGTDALMIALMALNIGRDDEVITIAHTWISTAEVIAILGAKPVFIDIESKTFNLDPELLEKAITPRTKAIMPVSLYGQMPDYTKINSIASKYNIPVIEDAAQSFGAKSPLGRSCAVTLIGSTSFFPSKPLGGWGDGGALFTNDDTLAEKMSAIKSHGGLKRFQHRWIGLNARLDTIQAAYLNVKMNYLDAVLDNRRRVANIYTNSIGDFLEKNNLTHKVQLPQTLDGNTHVWAQYTILMDSFKSREIMFSELKKARINVAIFYPAPLHLQECFNNLNYKLGDLPVTEYVCDRIINLPCYAELTSDEENYIINTFTKILKTIYS